MSEHSTCNQGSEQSIASSVGKERRTELRRPTRPNQASHSTFSLVYGRTARAETEWQLLRIEDEQQVHRQSGVEGESEPCSWRRFKTAKMRKSSALGRAEASQSDRDLRAYSRVSSLVCIFSSQAAASQETLTSAHHVESDPSRSARPSAPKSLHRRDSVDTRIRRWIARTACTATRPQVGQESALQRRAR